jgi:hypothetical protein
LFFVEVNSLHLLLHFQVRASYPDFAENDYVSRSKKNSGSNEALVHPALSLACSGDWFEFSEGVGKLGQLLQVEVAVLVDVAVTTVLLE